MKTKAQLKALVKGARFGRQSERALLEMIENSAAGGTPAASPAAAAGTDSAIIDAIVAKMEDYGMFTG